MTEDRIRIFLRYFYEEYIKACFEGYEVKIMEFPGKNPLESYDIVSYFIRHLDIYVNNADYQNEYKSIYQLELIYGKDESTREKVNDLQIFMIENIQLFLHIILEEAVKKVANTEKDFELKIYLSPIDNRKVYLEQLITKAEELMKSLGISPPAQG